MQGFPVDSNDFYFSGDGQIVDYPIDEVAKVIENLQDGFSIHLLKKK